MIQLRTRTEYSFRIAYGKVNDVIDFINEDSVCMTDTTTFGHVKFFNACEKAKKKPILGVEISVAEDVSIRTGKPIPSTKMAFLAKNNEGLKNIYELASKANEQFYFHPLLSYEDLSSLVSPEVFVLTGSNPIIELIPTFPNFIWEINPISKTWNNKVLSMKKKEFFVACSDNYYIRPQDKQVYQLMMGRERMDRIHPMHILDRWEFEPNIPQQAFDNARIIADQCNVSSLPTAKNLKYKNKKSLKAVCLEGAKKRKLKLTKEYSERLERELNIIKEKKFEDYFFIIADMIQEAKKHMLVGPARGSSAGSLTCYLLFITDVDPIVHGLIFERFIDINRDDLPDIDIDFQDDRRELIIDYLIKKYGKDKVGKIGTVSVYGPKSALTEVSKELKIPIWEIKDFKDSIIERASGDLRSGFAIEDSFNEFESGKLLLKKYPSLKLSTFMENHARHSGQHAAGIMICDEPIKNYCTIGREGVAEIDKKDAEALNILKIDALGLRTLSIIQECLEAIGKERDWIVNYPLNDKKAIKLLNDKRFAGIFQFEGYAIQGLMNQMKISDFSDISAITALARPGPLQGGGARDFVERRMAQKKIEYKHDAIEAITKETYGAIVYQEQVMNIAKNFGDLSWKDVISLRRTMGKSMGEDSFNQYWEKFKEGSKKKHKVKEKVSKEIWDSICNFGSYAFNKSHAVSYGLISYWCSVLKAHYPLEFLTACLHHEKGNDEDQGVLILREIIKLGYDYIPVDSEKSDIDWKIIKQGKKKVLLGGLINIKGISIKKAEAIIKKRKNKIPYSPGEKKMLESPRTPYDDVFEAKHLFGEMYNNPTNNSIYKIKSGRKINEIKNFNDDENYLFIGRIKKKTLKDANEYNAVKKRGYKINGSQTQYLNLSVEDDSGRITAIISRYKFEQFGRPIVESGKEGDWFLFDGKTANNGGVFFVDKCLALGGFLK